MRSACPTPAEMSAFHLGDLEEQSLERVANHLENCVGCEEAARKLDGLIDQRMIPFRLSARTIVDRFENTLPSRIGEYEILELVGQGGMGIVYRARHVQLQRVVALKMLIGGVLANRDERLRFRAEAEAVACLQHPHIVQLFDLGEDTTGRGLPVPYFTLEFVGGGNLSSKIGGRPQPPFQASAWLEPLARGLGYAHEKGIVHRDLKPSNVLLTPRRHAEDLRFRRLQAPGRFQSETRSGMLVGTAEYMSPEQAEAKENVGPATDIYALGAILYAMLTGKPPFQGTSTLDTLIQVRTQEPVAPSRLQPTVPRDLETICLKCLSKDPKARYSTALCLADDLRRFQAGEPVKARSIGTIGRLRKRIRRNPVIAGLLILLGTSLLGGFIGVTLKWREAVAQRERADEQTQLLDLEKQSALRQAYRGRIAAAGAALQNHDVADLMRQLEEAPSSLRGWEWRYFQSQLDDSSK